MRGIDPVTQKPLQAHRPPFRYAVLLLMSCIMSFAALAGQTINLAWDATSDPTVVGYYIYYGPSPGFYTDRFDAGTNLSFTTPVLPDGVYYFSATSRTAQGVESDFAN
ncbi:MAG: fibronectin type domain protein, partial [Verrucomicrobiales bacterium]|nr:fibronectin type domain protein [Verrucomicrobiales bacterium]